MSKAIGLFVDTNDLYHRLRRKFQDGKLCYEAYYDKVMEFGDIKRAVAYGMQMENVGGFISCLKLAGFDPRFKPPVVRTIGDREIRECDWNINLTLDVVNSIECLDIIVIGSAKPQLIPLIRWIQARGIKVIILASCVPKSVQSVAETVIEIDEELLEEEEE